MYFVSSRTASDVSYLGIACHTTVRTCIPAINKVTINNILAAASEHLSRRSIAVCDRDVFDVNL